MVPSSSQLYGEGGVGGGWEHTHKNLRLLQQTARVVAAAYKCFVTANLGGFFFFCLNNSGAAREVAWLFFFLDPEQQNVSGRRESCWVFEGGGEKVGVLALRSAA